MPTQIAKIGRERTLARLVRRLYKIEGRESAPLQRRAEAALLSANPRLARKEGFRNGATIVVPKVEGLEVSDEVSRARADSEGPIEETALRLQALASRIEDGFERESEKREKVLSRLDDREFRAAARKALPESVKVIEKTVDRLKREAETAEAERKRFDQALGEALKDLKALDALGRRSGPD
jgi:hypothetical protein